MGLSTIAAQRWLVSARWTTRGPGLAIWAWQALSLSVAAALLLAGFTLILPLSHLSVDLAELVRACEVHLRERYETPLGTGLALVGGGAAVVIVLRLAFAFVAVSVDVGQRRRHLRDLVAVLGRRHNEGQYVEVEHDVPLVYCLPGRRGWSLPGSRSSQPAKASEVIVTSAAVHCLSDAELAGVLRHERAHLETRHDLAIGAARALERAFLGFSLFRVAADQITRLAEMQADDRAGPRRPLAMALMRLGTAQPPAGAMGAHGANTLQRAQRLLEPTAALSPHLHAAVISGPLLMLALPLVLALAPALMPLGLDHCAGFSPPSC
ncbi:M56 family metallopeptidase [Nocardioides aurantiacus]|uniref:M56 family metallopeptidase n=1 Tax=Nocardioides aurantiacus TaxID=86796 RepID=UPI001476BC2A|nr:M56 family metallopeptidase [Nocardioides aurantiacus]